MSKAVMVAWLIAVVTIGLLVVLVGYTAVFG